MPHIHIHIIKYSSYTHMYYHLCLMYIYTSLMPHTHILPERMSRLNVDDNECSEGVLDLAVSPCLLQLSLCNVGVTHCTCD